MKWICVFCIIANLIPIGTMYRIIRGMIWMLSQFISNNMVYCMDPFWPLLTATSFPSISICRVICLFIFIRDYSWLYFTFFSLLCPNCCEFVRYPKSRFIAFGRKAQWFSTETRRFFFCHFDVFVVVRGLGKTLYPNISMHTFINFLKKSK